MAQKETISYSKPCAVCGKPDYCFRLHFENGNVLHCCARVHDENVIGAEGEFVKMKSKETNIGEFTYYATKEQAEADRKAYIAELKASGKRAGYKKKSSNAQSPKSVSVPTYQAKPVEGEYPIADSDKLDKVYRRFLSLLTLEETDYRSLCDDYNTDTTGDFVKTKLLPNYPIKSLPMEDWVRQMNRALKLTSPFRSEVCSKLKKEFGVIYDVPGFAEDPNGNVSFIGKEGMLFPLYDVDGRIVRLRIREKYPNISGEYQGTTGTYHHGYSKKNGQPYWLFTPDDSKESILVWYPGKDFPLEKGLPKGKASSKYKNLCSVYVKDNVNAYGKGSRSGSFASLYLSGVTDFNSVYITEGEKKAMVASLLLNVPCISLPGTGTFGKLFAEEGSENYDDSSKILNFLQSKGSKVMVMAYDADKNSNALVLKAEAGAVQNFIKSGRTVCIGEWNANFGKGLDDILVKGIRPSIYSCV